MPQYKLTYFNLKGLGEPIRFLLSYGGASFEDVRIDRFKSWPGEIKQTMPYGQMPILEIDGKIYHQTLPICRYLAKQFNLGGKTDLDALEIDAIANSIHDLRKATSMYYWDQNPTEKSKKRESLVNEVLPYYMKRFDDLVKKNFGYFHGGELTYADLFFSAVHEHMSGFMGFDVITDYHNLRQLTDKVNAISSIAAWREKRPLTHADLFFAALYEHMNAFMRIDVIKNYNNLRQLTDGVYAISSIAAWIAKRPVSEIYESPALLASQSQE